jgi:hypothetical protein
VIIEGVLPHSIRRRPLAHMIRRLDRGEFMRSQQEIELLLHNRASWWVDRFSYSPMRLERLACLYLKE